MRQVNVRTKIQALTRTSEQPILIDGSGNSPSRRRTFGTGGIFEKRGSRFLYISYRDANGKLCQESTKSESLRVAEIIARSS